MGYRRRGIILALLAASGGAMAAVQQGPVYVYSGTAPAGVCTGYRVWVNESSGTMYCCASGSWTACGSTGGSGLPADPAACTAGQYVTDQNQSGTLTCSQVGWSQLGSVPSTFPPSSHTHPGGEVTSAVATSTALAADPIACGVNNYVTDISAAGVLTCSVPPGTYALPDAAAGTTGGIRLTGDLGGTAASPTVPGLAGKEPAITTLPQTKGGTGAGSLTCTGAQKLTSNGTVYSCATDADTIYTLPAASTTLGGVKQAAGCSAGSHVSSIGAGGELTCTADSGGSGAPTGAQYWVGAADATLSAEKDLSGFTGLVLNTVGTPSAKAANTCTNQFARSDNASGVWTCGSIATADLPAVDISKGGTTETASTEDAVLVGASTTDWAPKVLPSCSNAATSKLLYDTATNTFSCGTDQTGGGAAPTVLAADVGANSTTPVQVWSIALTANKTNIVEGVIVATTANASTGTPQPGIMTSGLPAGTSCIFQIPLTATTGYMSGLFAANTFAAAGTVPVANAGVPIEFSCACFGASCGGNLLIGIRSEGAIQVYAKAGSYYTLKVLP